MEKDWRASPLGATNGLRVLFPNSLSTLYLSECMVGCLPSRFAGFARRMPQQLGAMSAQIGTVTIVAIVIQRRER